MGRETEVAGRRELNAFKWDRRGISAEDARPREGQRAEATEGRKQRAGRRQAGEAGGGERLTEGEGGRRGWRGGFA